MPAELGKPTVFWHNNQWEVFTNGAWTAYTAPHQNLAAAVNSEQGPTYPGPYFEPPFEPGSPNGLEPYPDDTSLQAGGYGYFGIPYGGPLYSLWNRPHNHFRHRRNQAHLPGTTVHRPVAGMGAPNIEIGQPNVQIGQPNVAIGKRTIGIGQPTIGIGQPNGIGQTTIGIGQTTIGIGQPSAIGRPVKLSHERISPPVIKPTHSPHSSVATDANRR